MDLNKLTVREIEAYLAKDPELTRDIYDALTRDPRRGVAVLLERREQRRKKRQEEEARLKKMLLLEEKYWLMGCQHVAGVDEAGRGPLAGPLVAAAVIFPPGVRIPGVDDSKKIAPKRREELCPLIKEASLAVGIGVVEPSEIDRINIYQAGLKAFALAVNALKKKPDFLLTDAYKVPGAPCPQLPLIRGDSLSFSIAAASIVAKVTRDGIMAELDQLYPRYGFSQNKGYPTREHREALKKHGPSPVHRKSFDLYLKEEIFP